MNIMKGQDGTVHAVPHDSLRCMTLCESGTVEALKLVEDGHTINCQPCRDKMTEAEQNGWIWTMPWKDPMHKHMWSNYDMAELIAHWYGIGEFPTVWSQFSTWAGKGWNVAIYRNNELGHPNCGQPRMFPYGEGEGAQFGQELPDRLPDFPGEINWRFGLEGAYSLATHNPDAALITIIGEDKLRQMAQAEQEMRDRVNQAESDMADIEAESDECPWCGTDHAEDDECPSDIELDELDMDDMFDDVEYELTEGDSDIY